MTMDTRIEKDIRNGWKAKTYVKLADGRVLEVATYKTYNGALLTVAIAHQVTEGGFLSYTLYKDYNKRLETTTARCTEKAVKEQHARHLGAMDAIVSDVAAFYAGKGV
jgi:hypothetical protein